MKHILLKISIIGLLTLFLLLNTYIFTTNIN